MRVLTDRLQDIRRSRAIYLMYIRAPFIGTFTIGLKSSSVYLTSAHELTSV